jgi:hypothetical protein
VYSLKAGQIVDYQVDYRYDSYQVNPEQAGDKVHWDRIGEYKSEKVAISFDAGSAEIKGRQPSVEVNRDIRDVDLNKLGYQAHVLRQGAQGETLFYGCKTIDCKKVFTVRSQYQLVNFTGFHCLVYFRHQDAFLLKYLESGDSLSLPQRLDDFTIQIKMITRENESESRDPEEKQRPLMEEEILVQREYIKDMRKTSHNLTNWSAAIPLASLKGEKLKMEESSFLTCATSLYTFIKKTYSDILASRDAVDINLMPPMIVKNCLPLSVTIKFVDSSNVQQEVHLEKDAERNLFCLNMASSVVADLHLQGFKPIRGFKLFNLQKYGVLEWALPIEDRYGRASTIYTLNLRKSAGQKVIFYCKQLLIDTIDSEINYYYRRPKDEADVLRTMIPFVNLGLQRQKLYVIPDRLASEEIWAGLQSSGSKLKDLQKVDISSTSTQMELCLKNASSRFSFSYFTDVYLATQREYLYSKITTMSPYYVVVNQSK